MGNVTHRELTAEPRIAWRIPAQRPQTETPAHRIRPRGGRILISVSGTQQNKDTAMSSSTVMILVDLLAVSILVFGIYYPRHHRSDLVVAFLGVNVGVLAVSQVLGSSTVGAGLGLARATGRLQRVAYVGAFLGLFVTVEETDVVQPSGSIYAPFSVGKL